MRSARNEGIETQKVPAQTFAEIAKNDFILTGAALLYLGLVSTDAYYRSFGLRFQFLSYPWNLIVFRGILTVVRFPALWVPLAIVIAILQVDRTLAAKGLFGRQSLRVGLLYLIAAGFVWWTTNAATKVGLKEATTDMVWQTTTLPHIVKLVNSSSTEERCERCVLLMLDSSQLVYFNALDQGDTNDLPDTQVRARSTINWIHTTR
jgi:hypothetical protein